MPTSRYRAAPDPGDEIVRQQAAALMRTYLVSFLLFAFGVLHPGQRLDFQWYLRAMCQALQQTLVGGVRRLVINLPPRNLKSVTAVTFAAWALGRNPSSKIMFVTYGRSLSKEHIDNCRKIIAHPFYRALFPRTKLRAGGVGELILRTTAGGGCRSVSVGGAATGFGADVIIIDDAMKADEINSEARRDELDRFYRGTLLTRLNDKRKGIIISIQQRLGDGDLPGRLIDAGALHLCLPAWDDQERVYDIGFGRIYRRPPGELLRPDDEPLEFLEEQRREMGPRDFETQYLQRPHALQGNIIRTDKFQRFELEDVSCQRFNKIAQSVDVSTSESEKGDWTVVLTFGHLADRWYLIDLLRVHTSYPQLRDVVLAQSRLWQPDALLIENHASGSNLRDDLWTKHSISTVGMQPMADKITRMVGQLALIEDGDILIPRDAPWLDPFLGELRSFPSGRHDDQVDALSQFLEWSKSKRRWANRQRDPETGRRLFVERREQINRRR